MRRGIFMRSDIKEYLFENQDISYKAFQGKLLPTVDPSRVIGVRTPILRRISKELKDTAVADAFMKNIPHEYFEENNLHAFFIEGISDYERCLRELNRFLPLIDNWATCDSLRPKCFKKHLGELDAEIEKWLSSGHEYTVRFGIEMRMVFYMDSEFRPEYLERVASIRSDAYYINMMIAWFFATALAKQWDATIPYIEQRRLDEWVHNKAIRKALESYRVTELQKAYLRTL